ncbi:DNA recombination protein RmuC [Marinobacterium litorale]|uniref:DNA recombination protein RmuC n=1 Tax=Marinobacterium litorale TaxID=404770 RepID=UPI0006852368|nr:DNA recombination protein RmuC [Marinobacterium litorale]
MLQNPALPLILTALLTLTLTWLVVALGAQRRLQAEQHRAANAEEQASRLESRLVEQTQTLEQTESARAALDVRCGRLEVRLEALEEQLDRQSDELEHSKALANERSDRLQQLREDLAATQERRDQLAERLYSAEAQLAEREQQLDSARRAYAELESTHTALRTTLTEKEHHFGEQIQQLKESRELLKREFELLANEIFERKGKAFTELNQNSLSALLNPIHSEMKGFKEKVERIHEQETAQRIQLKTELENLQKLNRDITDQAHKLTTALQGQKKMQGNWGELMLENVLEKSGLRPGEDYQREFSVTTEEGRLRPDAVIFLPQNKHLIIDAKTSLIAYTRFVNAEDEGERMTALREHTEAVKARINELADKDYYRLPGLNSPEIVVMFIPIESAYVEALRYDETLYQRAIERQVLVATPTTLLTSLNIVRQLWRFEDQSRHTAELARRAERFYSKLNNFLSTLQDVGKKIDQARSSFDRAVGQLADGRGNLIKQASEFKELGVSVQKELPAELVDRARLELDTHLERGHAQDE